MKAKTPMSREEQQRKEIMELFDEAQTLSGISSGRCPVCGAPWVGRSCSECLMPALNHPSHDGCRVGEGFFSVSGGAGRWKSWGTVHRDVSRGTMEEWRTANGHIVDDAA